MERLDSVLLRDYNVRQNVSFVPVINRGDSFKIHEFLYVFRSTRLKRPLPRGFVRRS